MLVHFAASVLNIDEDISYFRQIIKAVHEHGDIFTRDWVDPAYATWKKEGSFAKLDWGTLYKENMEALARADVVIADTTIKSFSVGYQTAVALQLKKPTLLLVRGKSQDALFASGMDETLLSYKDYNEKTLEPAVHDFLEENKIDTKDMRFNFFIDRPIYNYLRWAAYKTGKTKAEILRDLVSREIDKANEVNHHL